MTKFTGFADTDFTAAFAANDVVTIPEQERGSLNPSLSRVFGTTYLLSVATLGTSDLDTRRNLVFAGLARVAASRSSARSVASYSELGRTYRCGKYVLRPNAPLQLASIDQNAFGESGAGSLDLFGGRQTTSSTRGGLGLWIARPWTTAKGRSVLPELKIRWQHEFENGRRFVTETLEGAPGLPFTVQSTREDRDTLPLGAAVTTQIHDDAALFASFDSQLQKGRETHIAEGGVRLAF